LNIEAKIWHGWEHINITGGSIKTKFSVVAKQDDYYATVAMGNSGLIQFLDNLKELSEKTEYNNYYWWKMNPGSVISVINSVIREYE
jgi:hypothetical protein